MEPTNLPKQQNEAELSIELFERISGLSVTLHDTTHSLWQCLPPVRFRHSHPICSAVKLGPHGDRCIAFEVGQFRRVASRWKTGRLHRCHAGIVEIALPVFHQDKLMLTLFAGPATAESEHMLDEAAEPSGSFEPPDRFQLPTITHSNHGVFAEQLRQLGARLRCIIIDMNVDIEARDISRGTHIRKFVADHYNRPLCLAELADYLGLSEQRTRHVVVEQCGKSFTHLLIETRIEAGIALLLNSTMPITEISYRCGFNSPSSFCRTFRHRYGTSPRRWRLVNQA